MDGCMDNSGYSATCYVTAPTHYKCAICATKYMQYISANYCIQYLLTYFLLYILYIVFAHFSIVYDCLCLLCSLHCLLSFSTAYYSIVSSVSSGTGISLSLSYLILKGTIIIYILTFLHHIQYHISLSINCVCIVL